VNDDIVDRIGRLRIVPVVEIHDAASAPALGDALAVGGLPCAEITFRTANAAESIARLRAAHPDMLVGAGTILSVEQVDAALAAGAQFLVAPGLNPAVVAHARSRGATMIPGVCTPTEIEAALTLGLTTLKYFPAEAAGGVAFLKAVGAVYRSVRFMPTGGIGPANVAEYLAVPAVLACGGSWMVKRDLIASGRFDLIEQAAREAVALVGAGTEGGAGPSHRVAAIGGRQ
jgi:2-dehydro-3-deoxyphosphogluconate aldolase/(4S)-4-hydroxy-2-oxoglutarate aldolase